jgi:beta-glucosidase
VLFGDVNPSARLPVTFPNDESEIWLKTPQQYPGILDRRLILLAPLCVDDVRVGIEGESVYTEGLFVGYRWYDQQKLTPLFPFGHGLSYTSFSYDALHAEQGIISFTVTNTGLRAGAEVAQVYIVCGACLSAALSAVMPDPVLSVVVSL